MIGQRMVVGLAAAAIAVSSAEGATVLQAVDIAPYCNTRLQDAPLLGANESYPDGPIEFNGIPFSRPASGLNAWRAWYRVDGSVEGTRTLDIDVALFGAEEVYTLLNTFGGEQLPGTYASIQFYGDGGAFYEKHLDGNDDVRDYLNGEFTQSINGTSTVNVFTAGSGRYDEVRLDMQKFVLPGEFHNQTLDTIRLVDTGDIPGTVFQRLLLSGVTVAAAPVPEPTSLALWSGLGIMGLIAAYRRKRVA